VITGNKTRVLVIDDDPIVADTLAMVLNVSGFEATAVYSGERALELARLTCFDKLVTDVMMEPMTGIQAALALSHIHPNCQILLMSGNERTAKVLQEAADAGHTFDILAKPVHPSVIIDLLRAEPPTASACPSGLPKDRPSTRPPSIES
jgi:CheY-like chemotaxis protein